MLYLFMLPALLIVTVATVIPLLYTFILSFTNYNLVKPEDTRFTGFSNYIRIFADSSVFRSLLNTALYVTISVSATMILGVVLALLVSRVGRGKALFRICLFSPMMLAPVVVGVVWKLMFNYDLGILNYLLESLGFGRVNWLGNPKLSLFSVVLVEIWQWTSYVFLLCMAGLDAVSPEPVESAKIDGANSRQIFYYVTLPALKPILMVAAVFRFIFSIKSFDHIYALTQGGPGISSEVATISVWKYAFVRFDIGTSSALSVLVFLIMLLFSIGMLKDVRKKGE